MEPFKVAKSLSELIDVYPDAGKLVSVAREGGEQAQIALARLWLSEGIPFAFKECPGIYEVIRTWLSGRLEVEAKSINLAGSARLGSSLAPHKRGKSFDNNSDLDIFVVSEGLFKRVCSDFQLWSYEFEAGITQAPNDAVRDIWQENNNRGPKLIQRGFIDSKMIPNLEQFATAKNISRTMWLLVEKLNITPNAPKTKRASVRCYDSWKAFIRQTALNFS